MGKPKSVPPSHPMLVERAVGATEDDGEEEDDELEDKELVAEIGGGNEAEATLLRICIDLMLFMDALACDTEAPETDGDGGGVVDDTDKSDDENADV